MVTQGNLITQQAVRTLGEIGRQVVRVCPCPTRREQKAGEVDAGAIFKRAADLNRDRVLQGDVVRGARRHGPGQVDGIADANCGEI